MHVLAVTGGISKVHEIDFNQLQEFWRLKGLGYHLNVACNGLLLLMNLAQTYK